MDHIKYLKTLGAKGGKAGTDAQKKARASNLARINAERKAKASSARAAG